MSGSDVEVLIKRYVAMFDANFLEADRQDYQKYLDTFRQDSGAESQPRNSDENPHR